MTDMPEFRRILVRTPNWVGDAVMALPFLASLRLNAPQSEIHVLTRANLQEFFSVVPTVDGVLSLAQTHGFPAVWRGAKMLRPMQFDLGFCLPPSFGSALMMRLSGIPKRVGHASDRRRWLLTDSLPYLPNGKRPHRAESYLSLLELIWKSPQLDRKLAYNPGPTEVASVKLIWQQHGIPLNASVLAVAAGAAQPNKLWPAERFAEICGRWLAGNERVVVLVGGSNDREACAAVAYRTDSPRLYNLCAAGSLPLVAAIMRRAEVFVGNDSGLSHLAAASGVPLVVISGPGDPTEVAPFVQNAITVKKPLFCSPCYRNTCYRTDHPLECQDLVTVDEVWDAVMRISGGAQRRPLTS